MADLLHFSEDPHLERFVPRVAPTARDATPRVWALDAARAPAYWFPRDCPRVAAWAEPTTSAADRELVLGPQGRRVHAIEYRWWSRMAAARLYVYRFDPAPFRLHGDPAYAFVAEEPVTALGPPEPLGDLLALHERAGIELRLTDDLRPWWDRVSGSTCGFSGIRLGNARGFGGEPASAPAEGSPR